MRVFDSFAVAGGSWLVVRLGFPTKDDAKECQIADRGFEERMDRGWVCVRVLRKRYAGPTGQQWPE